ncbi:unnamed protein product [Effrenium voratum]|nr:unnamed protein product [Effrenium voratum]
MSLFAEQKSDDGDTVEADMASDPQHPGHQILQRLQQALRHGFQCRALQRTPHAWKGCIGAMGTDSRDEMRRCKSTGQLGASMNWPLAQQLLEELCQQRGQLEIAVFNMAITCMDNAWTKAVSLAAPNSGGGGTKPSPTVVSFNSALGVCDRSSQWQAALQLFDAMPKAKIRRSEISFLALGSQRPLEAFHALLQARVRVSGLSFNSAISSLSGPGSWRQSLDLLGAMGNRQLQADNISCSATMGCLSSHWRHAMRVFRMVLRAQVQADAVSYNTAISACAGFGWQHALRLLQSAGFSASVISYNAAISSCGQGGHWRQALLVKEQGGEANLVSFNAAISACEKGGQFQAAWRLLSSMAAARIKPTVVSYNACISACNGLWPAALHLLESMARSQIRRDVISFSGAVSSCEGHWPEALSLMAWMLRAQIEADAVSLNAAISTTEKGRAWQWAVALLESMHRTSLADAISYNAAISACDSAGEWAKALQLLCAMQRRSVRPTVVSFNAAISSCEAAWVLALCLLESMEVAGLLPDVITFTSAISSCAYALQWQSALLLLHQAMASHPMDVAGYNSVLHCYSRASKPQRALALFQAMPDTLVEADAISYQEVMPSAESARAFLPLAQMFWNLHLTAAKVLLDNNFYQKTLKLPFAQWVLLWLKKNFVGKCTVAEEVLLEVLTCEQHLGYKEVLEAGLTPFSLKLLLLASSWLRAVLPHVLSKIDRVSYGLLRQQQLQEADEKTPFSRLVMAVPFVGKDVPSRSSEFAHPDVAIGLTILAYRYEGLRLRDTRSIVAQLKQDCSRQMGPRDTRPAHLLFESWVREPIRSAPGSPRHKMRRLDCQNILPLSLFQPTDPKQMGRLHQQVQSSSCVAHFWLRQHVFPAPRRPEWTHDMNFRDYAQGAFRMRKVGKGQTIHLCVIPEVQVRIGEDLAEKCRNQLILDVPSWLLLNSCRSESLQSLKLLSQELSNGWRKQALQHLCADCSANGKMPTAERMRRFEGPQAAALKACLGPFQDRISFAVDDKILPPRSYREVLQDQCDEHAQFCSSERDRKRQHDLLERIERESKVSEAQEMQQGFTAEVVHEQEAEQQQEQEEEQEEEQESAFTRDDEQPNPWASKILMEPPEGSQDRPFYRLRCFRARPEQPLLPVDSSLWLSDNFFRPSWVGLGERRLKTCHVVLEWHPELCQDRQKRGLQLRMRRFFVEEAAAGGTPTEAAMRALARAKDSLQSEPLSEAEMAGDPSEASNAPRYVVVLTLAEAETLRFQLRHSLARAGLALRGCQGRLLEASAGFVPSEQLSSRLALVRLFNSEMFFEDKELALLEAELREVPLHLRQTWFEELLRLRRQRARLLWLDTPVAKLFTPQEQWKDLRSRCLLESMRRALLSFRGALEDLEALLQPHSPDALRGRLLRIANFSASDVQDAVNLLPVGADGLIAAHTLDEALQASAALGAQREKRGLQAAKRAQADAEQLERAQRVWSCQNCSFMNSALSSTCAICDFGWTGQRECPSDKWACTASTGIDR